MKDLTFLSPKSLAEASDSLMAYDNARIIAGGTDLLLQMERKKIKPDCLIDLSNITGMKQLNIKDGVLCLGAMTNIQSIHESQLVKDAVPVLAEAAGHLGCWQVRNRATLGGNLANAAPSAEMAPPLIALGAKVKIFGPGGERVLPLENFFKGPGSTEINRGELLVEVLVPLPEGNLFMKYLRHSLRRSMDIALVNAAVCFDYSNQVVKKARVVLGAVAPTPIRAVKTETCIEGQKITSKFIEKAVEVSSGECRPITDVRATEFYRREIVGVLIRRALTQALN